MNYNYKLSPLSSLIELIIHTVFSAYDAQKTPGTVDLIILHKF